MSRRRAVILTIGAVLVLGGCRRALFPEREPRTQFDTYDLVRQRYVPADEPDVFGNPRPALRARLAPRD